MNKQEIALEAYEEICEAISTVKKLYDIDCLPPDWIEIDEKRFYFNEYPKDQWFEIPDKKLVKKGKTQHVYIPSNYAGPIAMDATINKDILDTFKD